MKSILRNHSVLFLSIFFLIISAGLWFTFIKHEGLKNDKAYIESVGKNLNKELDKVKEKAVFIRKNIEDNDRPTFAKLISPSSYPYFVFRNNYLYFWSDNSFIPKQELLLGGLKDVQFLSQKSGKYVVHRETVLKRGDLFEIFFFIPLTTEYPIENAYLTSELNPNIFGNSTVSLHSHPTSAGGSIYTADGDYLFSLTIPEDPANRNHSVFWYIFIAFSFGVLFLIYYLIQQTNQISQKKSAGFGVIVLLGSLIIIRSVMLLLNFPFSLIEFDLFNSKYFASSSFSPSLGDLLINLSFLLIFAIALLRNYHKVSWIKKMLFFKGSKRKSASVVLLVLSFLSINYLFEFILQLFTHSQWPVDITESVEFGFLRSVSLLIIGILFTLFLIFTYIFSKLYLSLNKEITKENLLNFGLAVLLFLVLSVSFQIFYLFIFLITVIFIAAVIFLRMPGLVTEPRYGSYLYLLFSALVCALCAAYSIYVLNIKTDTINKQKFASQLLVENDVLGEYLLNEASFFIKNDPFVQSTILNPFSSKELIEHKIKRVYLGEYFEKYDVKVHAFDALGHSFNLNSEFTYWPEVISQFRLPHFKTDYANIYMMYDPGKRGFKRYLVFNKIRKRGAVIGYILIELKQKKIVPHSVYPELLVDKKFIQPWENKSYSYAIFDQEEIMYSYGQYNYEKDFSPKQFEISELFEEGLMTHNYHHMAIQGTDGKSVVVSSENYPVQHFFSNFSFLFILLMFLILLFVIAWSVNFRFKKLNINFSTKIQIYLNLAFFLPLFIVSITTLSIISSTYKENLNKSFIKKAETVGSTINSYLEGEKGKPSVTRLENLLLEKSRFIETDINLFDNKGKLMFSNQPLIFEAGLLSKLINPEAYSKIQDNKNNVFMLNEKVGKLKYNSVYIAIKSYESGGLLGILSIPFFESKQEVEKQLVEVLTTILNIFVSIFLVFLLLSYLVSKLLTVPLKLLTQKIRRTSLSGDNEPLEWNSKDEIGLLVGEYNRMLVKLEESKSALSRSEKESAWREMAQQVAHEIKNPLTPMKLSIQHLQRAVKDKRDDLNELTDKSLKVLLDQVNTLSEIATSFSAFAKMPIPKNEKFDLASVLASVAGLHSADKSIELKVVTEKGSFFVNGDEKLTGNIISNIIINGVQSVARHRKAEITATLIKKGKYAILSVKDNGEGIPVSVQEKIFLPNFSTKYAGSGLGLALAKRGVEHAGGKIWFETMEGQGTTFFIELPLSD